MERDDELMACFANDLEEIDSGHCNTEVWEATASLSCRGVGDRQPRGWLSPLEVQRYDLLTKDAKTIADYVADGTLTANERKELQTAFLLAHQMGIEREFVTAVNEQLNKSGHVRRLFVDERGSGETSSERVVLVINTAKNMVTDSHSFRAFERGPVKSSVVQQLPPAVKK